MVLWKNCVTIQEILFTGVYLKYFLTMLSASFFTTGIMSAQNELDVIRNSWLQYTDAPNSFYHYLTGEAFKMLGSREEVIAQIKTKDDLLKRQQEVRKTMWEILGPFPEKTPLNARITSTYQEKWIQSGEHYL